MFPVWECPAFYFVSNHTKQPIVPKHSKRVLPNKRLNRLICSPSLNILPPGLLVQSDKGGTKSYRKLVCWVEHVHRGYKDDKIIHRYVMETRTNGLEDISLCFQVRLICEVGSFYDLIKS